MTAAQLRDFHEDFFGASHAEIVVIGDFDPNAVRALLAERLDGWRSPKPFSDVLNLYANLAKDPTTQDFNTPDKENAFFLGGMPIEMRDSHADYPALVFGNYILGSGPASRLFGRIRGREGLSYGVGSGFNASPRSDGATFTVNAIAAPQNAAKVEASFRDELATVLRDGYTAEEFAAAKVSWAQGAPGRPHAGRRPREHARPLDARRAHDGLGRRARGESRGVDRRASARRDAPASRRHEDDVHEGRRLRGGERRRRRSVNSAHQAREQLTSTNDPTKATSSSTPRSSPNTIQTTRELRLFDVRRRGDDARVVAGKNAAGPSADRSSRERTRRSPSRTECRVG